MPTRTEWEAYDKEVLFKLDIRSVYESMGVRFTKSTPTAKGWLECWARDRPHGDHATAGVNVGNGPSRGYYQDMAGSGERLKLWDFAARYGGGYRSWTEARAAFAEQAGVPSPGAKPAPRPDDVLAFRPWSESGAALWCRRKPPIIPAALLAAGARMATYRGHTPVICFPAVKRPGGTPCGWVMVSRDGGPMIHRPRDGQPVAVKVKACDGSQAGLLNPAGVAALKDASTVWVTEGLTDLLALLPLLPEGHVAVSGSGGCGQWPDPAWATLFAGKTVYVVFDRDEPGQLGAGKWVSSLSPDADVRSVQLPFPLAKSKGKDLRDYLNGGGDFAGLLTLAEAAPRRAAGTPPPGDRATTNGHPRCTGTPLAGVQPADLTPERELLDSLQLHVLGEYGDGSVEVFSGLRRKLSTVRSVSRFSYSDLLQVAGDVAKRFVYDGKAASESVDARKRSMSDVRNALGLEAGRCRLTSRAVLGIGQWRLESSPATVVVDAGRAAVWDGKTLTDVDVPRVGDQVLDFAPGEPWCDFGRLRRDLATARADGPALLDSLETLFAHWNWRFPQDAKITAALALATWVQTLWEERPLVFITGSTYTGKSLLFDKVLDGFFGRLLLHSGVDISAAGLRQHVGNTAVAVLLDEMERSKHRSEVMELLRTSTRGGRVYRGTANQRGVRFSLRHITWSAATESGLRKEQDKNRFITMELERMPAGGARIPLPPPPQLDALGAKALAVALAFVDDALALYRDAVETPVPGVPGRVVDCFAVPACMSAAVRGTGLPGARALLAEFVGDRFSDTPAVREEEDLLRDILESLVPVGGGHSVSVNEVINSDDAYAACRDAVERHGVGLAWTHRGRRPDSVAGYEGLFINTSACLQHLLGRNERWRGTDIESVLRRLPGAARTQHQLAGGRGRGVLIPAQAVLAVSAEIAQDRLEVPDGEG
jgi:hypothetical protein